MSEYEVVDHETHEFEEGDRFVQVYDLEFPSWFPSVRRNEVLDGLSGYTAELQAELDNQLDPDTRVDVVDARVEELDGDRHRYFVTYEVESVGDEAITPAGIWFIIYGVVIVLGIVGIAWTLRETRLLLGTEGGGAAFAALAGIAVLALTDIGKKKGDDAG